MQVQNNNEGKYLVKYEDIYRKLEKLTDILIKGMTIKEIQTYILKQGRKNIDGQKNSLIELPKDNIKSIIRKTYTSIDYLQGEVCMGDETEKFDGITNMTLLMLMANRLSKFYKFKKEENTLTTEEKEKYSKYEIQLLVWKDNAMSDVISNLYVMNKENKDAFFYGYRKDNNNKDSLVIDLPYIGQICVHFGNKMDEIINIAQKKAMSILEKKKELGQLSQEQFEKIIEEMQEETILPNYSGRLYEYTSAFPLEYEGQKIKEITKDLEINNKLPEEIDKEDVKRLYESNLNSREQYYLAIKLGWNKKALNELVDLNNSKNLNVIEIGRSCINQTTAEERQFVRTQENKEKDAYGKNKSEERE